MRVLLVNPPFNRLKGIRTVYFPMGLGYLAAVLRDAGFETRIWNAETPTEDLPGDSTVHYGLAFQQHQAYSEALNDPNQLIWKEASTLLREFAPDIVGITTMSPKFPSALKLAAIAKQREGDCHVVMGGVHPTVQAEQVMQNREVDFVVRGEGERTVVELCEALRRGERRFAGIRGLSFRDAQDGRVFHNEARGFIENLDTIPFPARELILHPELHALDIMCATVASRGCPFRCGFCEAQNLWTRRVRFRSAENIAGELGQVSEKYGSRDFHFWDDSFTVSKERTLELCRAIIARRLDIQWYCSTRADLLDDELLGWMRRAGCRTIAIGLESGSERVLNLIRKRITVKQVLQAIRLIHRHAIRATVFLMMGFPEEREEELQQTLAIAGKLGADSLRFAVFTPYPGSEQFDVARDMGLIPKDMKWDHFDHQSPENHFVKDVAKERFHCIVRQMSKTVDRHNRSSLGRLRRAWRELRHPVRRKFSVE